MSSAPKRKEKEADPAMIDVTEEVYDDLSCCYHYLALSPDPFQIFCIGPFLRALQAVEDKRTPPPRPLVKRPGLSRSQAHLRTPSPPPQRSSPPPVPKKVRLDPIQELEELFEKRPSAEDIQAEAYAVSIEEKLDELLGKSEEVPRDLQAILGAIKSMQRNQTRAVWAQVDKLKTRIIQLETQYVILHSTLKDYVNEDIDFIVPDWMEVEAEESSSDPLFVAELEQSTLDAFVCTASNKD